MDASFFGTWNLNKAKTTGKEDFAKAMGVNDEMYAALDKLGVTMTVAQEGEGYKFGVTFQGDNAPPASSYVAVAGKPVEVPALDGSKAELVLSIEGATVKEDYKSARGTFTITRTVSGNEMTAVSVAGPATLTQYFNRA